jgi:hypothetical protein
MTGKPLRVGARFCIRQAAKKPNPYSTRRRDRRYYVFFVVSAKGRAIFSGGVEPTMQTTAIVQSELDRTFCSERRE